MKKIIILLAVALSLNVMAQNAVGDWMIHTSFAGDAVATVIETRQFVYYQSGANLFRLDKSTGENEALSKINELSDMGISNVYYNYDKDYVVVVYSNSNIDVIRSNGTVVNMPEIKDAVLTLGRTINDVTFAPGLMYLATDFGYVVIDDSKMIVKESHQYGEPLMSVAQVGNLLLLSSVSKIYYGDAGKYYENLIAFKQGDLSGNCRFWPINDNTFYSINDSTEIVTIELDEEKVAIFSSNKVLEHEATVIQHTYEGILLNVPDDSTCYKAGKDGLNLQVVCSNGELCSANPDGDGEYWAAGSRGLHLLELENYYLPNALSFDSPFWMTYNQEQDKLYVSTTAANGICNTSSPTEVNTYDGVKWTDVTPKDVPLKGNSRTRS